MRGALLLTCSCIRPHQSIDAGLYVVMVCGHPRPISGRVAGGVLQHLHGIVCYILESTILRLNFSQTRFQCGSVYVHLSTIANR